MHTIHQSSCHCSWNDSYTKVSQLVDNMARLYWQIGKVGTQGNDEVDVNI
jgi:hypothetical protein